MASNILKIGFIGGGNIARALAKGFISSGTVKADSIISSCHPTDYEAAEAFQEIGCESTNDNTLVVKKSDIVILAVKPNVVTSVLADIKKAADLKTDKLFLSVAMGVPIKRLEQGLPSNSRVIRVMPNTPVLVRNGASVYVRGTTSTNEDISVTKTLLNSVGTCEEVPENLLDTITALSGSGPAYVYVLIESLADGAVKMGLPRNLAYRLAAQTVIGSGRMVLDTKLHVGTLKDDVTSPAGSTASGLHYLEEKGFRGAVIGAIEAAAKKCVEVSSKC